MATITEYEGIFTQVDADQNETRLYPIPKNGGIQIVDAVSTDGVAYTATVKGVEELTVGQKITIIPAVVSTSVNPTLNVNGLGAKYIRMPGTYNTTTCSSGPVASWLSAGKPVTVTWDGTQWETDIQRPAAQSMSGTVPVANGGTGATTGQAALSNLGIKYVTQSEYDALGTAVNSNGVLYIITDATAADARANLGVPTITALYNVSITLKSGKGTYSNSAITSSSIVFVQRRTGTAGDGTVNTYGTTVSNGSVTIVSDDTKSTTINLNILIITP